MLRHARSQSSTDARGAGADPCFVSVEICVKSQTSDTVSCDTTTDAARSVSPEWCWVRFDLLEHARAEGIVLRTGVEDKSDDETVKTQNFGENEDQNHTNEETGLLGGTTDTSVTDNADGETSGETGETDRETGAELNETGVERHGALDVTRDEHTDDETVNGNDTSHDNGNDTLDQKVRSEDTHGRDTDTGLGSTVRGTETY